MNTQPTTAITEYNPITAALAGIEKFRGLVCDVKTPQGMAEAKAAQREVGALRIALEKTRKKVKEDVIARGKLIDGEANRIFAMIAEIEIPIMEQIDAEEDRVERERQAAIEAEQKRLADEEAARKRAEEEKIAAERRQLEEERARFEAEQRAAREKAEAEERARREVEEKARRERQAEEDRLAAERKRVEEATAALARAQLEKELAERRAAEEAEAKKRAEQEAIERKAREEKEAIEREKQRKVQEDMDAWVLLKTFVDRFGHLKQFGPVVKAIKALAAKPEKKAA